MNVLEIPDIDLKKELKKCNSMEDLVGKNGLMQRLFGGCICQQLFRSKGHPILGHLSSKNIHLSISAYF